MVLVQGVPPENDVSLENQPNRVALYEYGQFHLAV
jgi:hypothetical protein